MLSSSVNFSLYCNDEGPLRSGSKLQQPSGLAEVYELSLTHHKKQMCLHSVFAVKDRHVIL